MVDTDVINVIAIDVIFAHFIALRCVALNKNRNAVFIQSTKQPCAFILTAAIYSSCLCTLSISGLFWVVDLYLLI